MTNVRFDSAFISGMVSVVPPKIKTFDQESLNYDIEQKQLARIKKSIGLDKRHVTDENTTTLDLCLFAAQSLIEGLGIEKNAIDGLICISQTPDHFQPCNSAITHGRLGLSDHCASFDVNLGCSGYVYGLWLAHMMIESKSCKKVLVLAGDTLSKCVSAKDRSVGPLFGDGGTATLIEYTEDSNPTYFSMHTDGSGAEHIKIPAGGFRMPLSPETAKEFKTEDGNIMSNENLQMDGGEVFNFSVNVEPKAIEELLKFSGEEKENIDYLIFHQANKYIIGNIVRRLKFPKDKAPANTVEKYGNQSSASIPTTINDALGDELVLNQKKVILSGFGVGLSWASCLTNMKLKFCPKVITFNRK